MKGDVIIYKLLQLITTFEACHAGLKLKRDDRLGRRASRFPGRCTMFILSRMNMALINLSLNLQQVLFECHNMFSYKIIT